MPWLLGDAMDQRYVDWTSMDENWKSVDFNRTGYPDFVQDPAHPVLRYQQASKHKILPDLMLGTPSGVNFISARLRAVVEATEPFRHRYIPIVLRTIDERLLESEFFMFKHGDYIADGVIEAKSKVGLMGERHEALAAYSTPAYPKITWKAAAIEGHHFFTDKYLKRRIFVSDVFLKRMKREKLLTSLKIVESFAE